MIIVRFLGGLGNQMFQYAAGRCLAERFHQELKLDLSAFNQMKGVTPRHYELQIFRIHEKFVTPPEITRYTGETGLTRLLLRGARRLVVKQKYTPLVDALYERFINMLMPFRKKRYLREKSCEFNPKIYATPGNCLMEGFWQSEKYFRDIEAIIRKEFTLKCPLEGINLHIAQNISQSPSVSIHVRRGDYVTLESARERHGDICDLAYYQKAIKIIAGKISAPHFFVFSDDIPWVKANLEIPFPVSYVDHNQGGKSYEDMRLMSLCKHNIIANSSFSWWGAWLNQNKKKVVIAPNRWWNDPMSNSKDVIPESWIKIEK